MVYCQLAKFLAALRHAFAVDTLRVLSAEELDLLDCVARAVVQRRMTGPALVCLESIRPLNYVSSQVMVFLEPLVGNFISTRDYKRIATTLQHRESIQVLITKIEAQEASLKHTGKSGGC
ncbi:MAG: hypothetical protein HYZ81_09580 [Nitrospinae bacterium]|nr:hypothetical protein [Nitrospinota bacterium]